jgi:hypothetical protein
MRILAFATILLPLLAGAAAAAETVAYKGRSIEVGDSKAAATCLGLLRKAIDMVEGMPPRLRAMGATVKTLRCNPGPGSAELKDNVTGVYTHGRLDDPKVFIDFPRNPVYVAPGEMAVALVANSVYARWHNQYRDAKRRGATAEADRLARIIDHQDLDANLKAECEVMAVQIEALTALKWDDKRVSAMRKAYVRRNC